MVSIRMLLTIVVISVMAQLTLGAKKPCDYSKLKDECDEKGNGQNKRKEVELFNLRKGFNFDQRCKDFIKDCLEQSHGLEEDRAAKGYKKYLEDIKAKHG